MFYKGRNKLLFYYRLFFILVFLLVGVAGICIMILDCFAGIDLFNTESTGEKQALYVTSSFFGLFGLITGLLMLNLMREKRKSTTDRRHHTRTLDFADRRSSTDRRGSGESGESGRSSEQHSELI